MGYWEQDSAYYFWYNAIVAHILGFVYNIWYVLHILFWIFITFKYVKIFLSSGVAEKEARDHSLLIPVIPVQNQDSASRENGDKSCW